MPDTALAALVLLPFIITFFLKSNAALGFLTLCLGFLVSTSSIGDLKSLLSQTHLTVSDQFLGAGIIFLPFIITLVLTHKTAGKDGMFLFQLVSALFSGALLALTVGPLLSSAGQLDITASKMWPNLLKVQAAVIGIGAMISLLLIWSGSFKHQKKH